MAIASPRTVAASPRQVRIGVSPELIEETLTTGNVLRAVVERGLPVGAKFVRCFEDYGMGTDVTVWLVFQHESFAVVPNNEAIPTFNPMFAHLAEGK